MKKMFLIFKLDRTGGLTRWSSNLDYFESEADAEKVISELDVRDLMGNINARGDARLDEQVTR